MVLTAEQGTLHKSEAVSIFAFGMLPYTASAISLETIIKVVPVLGMLIAMWWYLKQRPSPLPVSTMAERLLMTGVSLTLTLSTATPQNSCKGSSH